MSSVKDEGNISKALNELQVSGTEGLNTEQLNEELSKLNMSEAKDIMVEEEKKEAQGNIEEKEEEIKISPEKMDENIYDVFLTTLKICITDEMLPLDPGKLYKEYMKKVAKELNLPFDIKVSSYKKINNFLKSIMKSHKLISFGNPSSSQYNEYLLSICKENPLYLIN